MQYIPLYVVILPICVINKTKTNKKVGAKRDLKRAKKRTTAFKRK